MLKTKIAVFVSGGGTNLQALIDAQKSGVLQSGEIALVLASNHKAYALTRAAENNIPSAVVVRKEFDSQLAYEEKVKEVLKEHGIELIVLAGFMSILSENFTSAFPKRIINIHPSLIPSFCGKGYYGLKVHEAALAYGVKVTGATVHYVNEIPDGGEILLQKAVEVKDGDTPEVLQRRVMEEAEWILLPRATEQVSKELQKGR
ncbi:phosphoribosylglycinamide formyltransferase [Anaerotignum sp.]|uniref:phosphoribosylglycinamide formyltransferase n=1 Tax=Anaerotignum sp. TaxID=2039241 RepID=UPI002A915AFF|nr:phosphoribosylglycinamide formyltransferase [Anaerotignum sp.]MCI7656675.1 phosphoribosylglycinamide formyltransferase [Clostridia bacterium]MDY5414173.1 phosphoribosylglycinamide formyltransferase [Anaerotignum sp.]